MVAKIISGKSIRGLLNYNEAKLATGQARLIMASRFGTDLERLSMQAKLRRFEYLTLLNTRVKTNALHIMLNFDRGDRLDISTFQQIAGKYMDRIGFEDQPYLVYQHHDVSHPHLHIVTTNIQANGKRIDIHNIGRTLSETARKEIENEFKLVKAEGRKRSEALVIDAIDIEKVSYGETPTKRAINNVVSVVLKRYSFTSFAEYNAVLQQFNVIADRGKENTPMFEKRGLVYSIIDRDGKRIGIPFKASLLTGRPTLDRVEKNFEKNRQQRQSYKENLKGRITDIFKGYTCITKDTLIRELQKQQINILFRQNGDGLIYGLTFIDHLNRTVFNGSDLGKNFSAKSIMEKLSNKDLSVKPIMQPKLQPQQTDRYQKNSTKEHGLEKSSESVELLSTLLVKAQDDYTFHISKRKKKRKTKGCEQDQELTL